MLLRVKPPQLRGKIDEEWFSKKLFEAFMKARKHKQRSVDEFIFEANWPENLQILMDEILDGKYKPSRSVAFVTHKPVDREIFAAPFRDRVVHHFIYDMVADWWDRRFIYNSFSCRKGKGTLFGIKQCQKAMRKVTKGGKERGFVVKLDVQGYFMSLSRQKLYERAVWGLKRQYPSGGAVYRLLRYLWQEIIFDDPIKGVRKRPPLSDWNALPDSKTLFKQPEGQGIVIGNLSSQLLSNIYLDLLDRFVTKQLGYKYYGRYVDDFYIMVPYAERGHVIRDVKVIEEFLLGIGLTLHPKKRYFQPIEKGMEFLGVWVHPNKIVPGSRFRKSFYQAAYACMAGLKDADVMASYLGYCKHYNSRKLCEKVFDSVGWKYL